MMMDPASGNRAQDGRDDEDGDGGKTGADGQDLQGRRWTPDNHFYNKPQTHSNRIFPGTNGEGFRSMHVTIAIWSAIALTGILAALVYTALDGTDCYHSVDEQEQEKELLLLDAGSLQPTSSFLSASSMHRWLKSVYNEQHAPLFPLDRSDIMGFTLATFGLLIAAGGGIGGGGILVPIYILVLGFSPKHAIPLSNVTVFSGAIANTIFNVRKRHPLADRPLIDWDLILVMEPLTIAGALLGAFLNKLLPELLLTVLLVVLLSFTAHDSLTKAIKMYKKETAAIQAATGVRPDGSRESELTKMAIAAEHGDDHQASEKLLGDHNEDDEDDDNDNNGSNNPKDDRIASETTMNTILIDSTPAASTAPVKVNPELQKLLDEERVAPAINVNILTVLFVVVLSINLLKGGGAFRSPLGIRCGSTSFWIANAIMIVWIVAIAIYARTLLIAKYYRKRDCQFPYVDGDIQWNPRATIVYPVICCLAGFFAGMFGVGGGIVKGPLMLAMGVHPAVSSATSACMILYTSFTATTSFVVFGLLVPDYAVICLIIGFLATVVGQAGLSYLMKRAQRNSYIAFSIGIVVLVSAFLMTIQSVLSMASGEKHHAGGICGQGD